MNELNTLSKRLEHLRESQGWSKTALSRLAQSSRAAVARWYADGPMPEAAAQLLCAEADGPWSPQWLMEGTGPMLLAGAPAVPAQVAQAIDQVADEATTEASEDASAEAAAQAEPADEPPAKAARQRRRKPAREDAEPAQAVDAQPLVAEARTAEPPQAMEEAVAPEAPATDAPTVTQEQAPLEGGHAARTAPTTEVAQAADLSPAGEGPDEPQAAAQPVPDRQGREPRHPREREGREGREGRDGRENRDRRERHGEPTHREASAPEHRHEARPDGRGEARADHREGRHDRQDRHERQEPRHERAERQDRHERPVHAERTALAAPQPASDEVPAPALQAVYAAQREGLDDSLRRIDETGEVFRPWPSSRPGEAVAIRIQGDGLFPVVRDGWTLVTAPHRDVQPGEFLLIALHNGRILLRELLFCSPTAWTVMTVDGTRRESVANEQVKKVASVMAILPSWVLNE